MDLNSLIPQDHIHFEEALLKDPDNESLWLDYAHAAENSFERLKFILERAVTSLPASQSLWNVYLLLPWTDKDQQTLESLYKRALRILDHTPTIWKQFIELEEQKDDVAAYTNALDSALFYMHHSHHKMIWEKYLQLANSQLGQLCASIYKRIFEFQDTEKCPLVVNKCECVLKVARSGDINCALSLYRKIPRTTLKDAEKDVSFISIFLDILINEELFENCLLFERMASDAALDIPPLESKYLLKVAIFYQKRQENEKARHYFHIALNLVTTIKDLAHVYKEYTNFLDERFANLILTDSKDSIIAAIELDFFEKLLQDEPILAIDTLLKSEPNNIDLWIEKSNVYKNKDFMNDFIGTLIEAIKSVNPMEEVSRNSKTLADIWIEYANLYTALGDHATARLIYTRAVKSQFRSPDELATIYSKWSELALLNSDEEALQVVEEVLLAVPPNLQEIQYKDTKYTVQERVFKSTQLWTFYLDLLNLLNPNGKEERYNKRLQTAFETMTKVRVITLRLLFRYTDFMSENNELQNCYAMFEAGVQTFETPTSRWRIWNRYLNVLVTCEKNKDIIIDAFERCIASKLPGYLALDIFKLYSETERKASSLFKSVKVLQRGLEYLTESYSHQGNKTEDLNKIVNGKFELYLSLFNKISVEFKDLEMLRRLLSSAVQDTQLSLPMVVELTLKSATFELEAGQVGRARAFYKHVASLAHPNSRAVTPVWTEWTQLESTHGDENTYRNMLKFKKAVEKEYEAIEDFKSEINPMGFVKADSGAVKELETKDPNAIEIDMDI